MKKQKQVLKAKRQNYTPEQRENARKYYLRGLYIPEISKLMDIPTRTLEKWQQSGKWTLIKDCPEIKKRVYELRNSGHTVKQVSEMLNLSPTTIWRYCNIVRNEK